MQLRRVAQRIHAAPHCSVIKASSIYRSAPLGANIQPPYLNAVIAIRCSSSALGLLRITQGLERSQGRRKRQHWGPRSIDIDILLHGHSSHRSRRLRIPHPRMGERPFVLLPLLEIAADVQMPDGHAVSQLPAANTKPALSGIEKITPTLWPRRG